MRPHARLMADWLRQFSVCRATWVWFYRRVLKLLAAPWPFCVALSLPAHWHARFYIAALSVIFFWFGFRQWRSSTDRVVNLNTTIQLPLFWRSWTRARASTHPHVRAWHMGRDCSDYRASELTDSQVSGLVFSWFLENTEKTRRFLGSRPRLACPVNTGLRHCLSFQTILAVNFWLW